MTPPPGIFSYRARWLHRGRGILRYFWSLLLTAAATGLSWLVAPYITPTNLVVIYLLAVVLAAVYLGRGPAILASVVGVLAFDYFFVPPHLTLVVANTEYLLTFLGLLMVGLVISYLTAQARDQAEAAKEHETETLALYALSRDLAAVDSLDAILSVITGHLERTFGPNVSIFLSEGERLKGYHQELNALASEDVKAAEWAFHNNEATGKGTSRFPTAWARYVPLKTVLRMVGVLGARPRDPYSGFAAAQLRLFDAFAVQIAAAVERVRLAEQTHKTEMLEIADKLQNALLSSISHDLRTPLVSITGALSSLSDAQLTLDEADRHSLIETASEEANRLNRLVGNLLDMSRLESGGMRIKRDACDLQDLIGAALEEVGTRLGSRSVVVDVPDDLPIVQADFVLIERVLVNVIDNALKYSPPDSPIEVRVHLAGAFIEIFVADRGAGIPPEDLSRIFDKFYRVQRPNNVLGTGLGLAISKGIVDAHGGFISAENRPEGGAIITIALPVEVHDERA